MKTLIYPKKLVSIFTKSSEKVRQIKEIGLRIGSVEDVDLFDFSLGLYQIKDLLFEEAKMSQLIDADKLSKLGSVEIWFASIFEEIFSDFSNNF